MAESVEMITLRKGPWSSEEDQKLIAYINRYGVWNWKQMAKAAGLQRSGKSCRLRWVNYLKPGIKRGNFTQFEEETIIELHRKLGTRWSLIASRLPGRTDNEIKNYWNSYLSKRLKHKSVQIFNVETQQKISSCSSEVDLQPAANAPEPEPSNFKCCYNIGSSSSNPAAKIDRIQIIGSSETFGELQSILEQPCSNGEDSYSAENSKLVWFQNQGNSCNDAWPIFFDH